MKASVIVLALVAVGVVALAVLNPNEGDYREYVRQKEGIAGTLNMALADLLAGGKQGGIKRDNYFVASRFYFGGDGVMPRRDVAWGFAGKFWEIEPAK